MKDLIPFFDADYGIKLYFPIGWQFFAPTNIPFRFAVSPNSDTIILATSLEMSIVEQGLRAISKYLLENITECKVKNAKNLYNIEECLRRKFGVSLETTCGEIFVHGILEALEIEGTFGKYLDYFVKCIISEHKNAYREFWDILEIISKDKDLPGITFNAPLARYEKYIDNPYGSRDLIWSVPLPYTALAYTPTILELVFIVGSMIGKVQFMTYNPKHIDENYVRAMIESSHAEFIKSDYELKIINKEEDNIYAEAYTPDKIVAINIWWGEQLGDEALVVTHTFAFPSTAYYGAKKIIEIVVTKTEYTSKLVELLLHPTTPIMPVEPPIRSQTTFKQKPIPRQAIYRSRETQCDKTLLKSEIENIKMQLRLLEADYKTRLETLQTIKTSDVTTGMYTFETPTKKLRFLQSKLFSPIIGDRFWEDKESVYLPYSRRIFATRHYNMPRNRYAWKELKWKVEEEIKKLKSEYQKRKKELEDKLRELEEKYKQC